MCWELDVNIVTLERRRVLIFWQLTSKIVLVLSEEQRLIFLHLEIWSPGNAGSGLAITRGALFGHDEDGDDQGGGDEKGDGGIGSPLFRVGPPAAGGRPDFLGVRESTVGTHCGNVAVRVLGGGGRRGRWDLTTSTEIGRAHV